MAELFIQFPNGSNAFITGVDPTGCEHDWEGEEIYCFHNDERIMKKSDFEKLPEEERNNLNLAGGEVSCSKCGSPYTAIHNPHYM